MSRVYRIIYFVYSVKHVNVFCVPHRSVVLNSGTRTVWRPEDAALQGGMVASQGTEGWELLTPWKEGTSVPQKPSLASSVRMPGAVSQVSWALSLTTGVVVWSLDGGFWVLCSLFWGCKVAGRAREVLWLADLSTFTLFNDL